MNVSQKNFRIALLDPEMARPAGLVDDQGAPAGRRFDVYRNNVTASLTEALETAFPVLRKLVGEGNFKLLSNVFLRKHPPSSPMMMFYGDEMPGFLSDFGPTSQTGYLPDVARLELAMRHSYHCRDAVSVQAEVLQTIPPDKLMGSTIELAPALRLIRSQWPIHAIWVFNSQPNAPKPEMAAQDVLVTRPEYDPEIHLLGPGGAVFIQALLDGQTFGAALDAASGDAFDLSTTLALLLGAGAISRIKEPTDA